ncbi:RNA polymerase sigma-70 factor [Chryseosolibacter indicus]|uniref:RNA polymerase sigma-70 factor n=1 Tax=Chryseosolibacter indicus TaxID=2782351 RepID=A0ABS5VUX4_9BACT|nr:RNA polymerase sigma-70 factor [Chryseosolibacter indicus]MBT1704554.1 RNA polymerase sigma-70 factor [Chryseosolibacter indicus]
MKVLHDNSKLVLNLKNGDAQSMELLFRRLYPQLCAFANKFLHDLDEAEEIVQEVFFKIWKNRANLNENESIQSYLFTAVKNGCFSLLAHNKIKDKYASLLEQIYLSGEYGTINHDSLIATELEKDFSRVLETLPPECRRIFELSRFEGRKYHEIANELNISIKTVETQMSRALSKIRVQLKDYLVTIILLELLK